MCEERVMVSLKSVMNLFGLSRLNRSRGLVFGAIALGLVTALLGRPSWVHATAAAIEPNGTVACDFSGASEKERINPLTRALTAARVWVSEPAQIRNLNNLAAAASMFRGTQEGQKMAQEIQTKRQEIQRLSVCIPAAAARLHISHEMFSEIIFSHSPENSVPRYVVIDDRNQKRNRHGLLFVVLEDGTYVVSKQQQNVAKVDPEIGQLVPLGASDRTETILTWVRLHREKISRSR